MFLFVVISGANAPDDLKLGLLELKLNYKLMMVGSLESDIKDVESRPLDSLVVDDFEDTDEKKEISIHNSEVLLVIHILHHCCYMLEILGILSESEQADQRLSSEGAESTASG